MTPNPLAGVRFQPDPDAPQPLYRQLGDALREAIATGSLAVGARLPSERDYAARLGVSRTTVTAAYQELKDQGLLRGYVGRGVVVLAADVEDGVAGAGLPWPQLGARLSRQGLPSRLQRRAAEVTLGDGWLHPELLPAAALQEAAVRAAANPEHFVRAAPPFGLPALRDAIAQRESRPGGRVDADDVLVCGGAQQGINLVARALLGPGDRVLTESPTWHGAVRAFRAAGAEVSGVPMDHEGIDPEALEDALLRQRPKLVYLIPTLHCPTGRVAGLARRRRVLALCQRYRTPILESQVYGELMFDAAATPPSLRRLDERGLVIELGSVAKSLSPALRLGWLIAPRAALTLLGAAKAGLDLGTPVVPQAILADVFERGIVDRHLVRLRRALATRRDTLVAALARHAPELRLTSPAGGLYLWGTLPPGIGGAELEAAAEGEGVAIRGGEAFLPEAGPSRQVRLCFAAAPTESLDAGAERVGRALRRLLAEPRVNVDRGHAAAWV